MPARRLLPFLAAACTALLAAAATHGARAEPQIRLDPPADAAPRLRLKPPASPYDADQALKAQGVAHTALDHNFRDAQATAAVGFLCGLAPSTASSGGAGAMGVDRDGRFLGAQLRLGFR